MFFFFNLGAATEIGTFLKPGFLFFIEEGEDSNWDLKKVQEINLEGKKGSYL